MRPQAAGTRKVSRARGAVCLVVVALVMGSMGVGCSLFRRTPKSTPAGEPGGGQSAAPTREILAGATRQATPLLSTGPGFTTPSPQPAEIPDVATRSTPNQPLITIEIPEPGQPIYNPVYVRGSGIVPLERTLQVQVSGMDGQILARGLILFDPLTASGQEAVFEGTLPFPQPEQQQLGSVRVLMQNRPGDSVVDYAQVLVVLLPAGSGPTDITIDTPVAGTAIDNPVRVEGTALAPQNQVTVRLKAGPAVLAAKTVPLAGEIGEPGAFSVDLSYAPFPATVSQQPGYPPPSEHVEAYIEVFYRSPKDGRIAEIAALPVEISLSARRNQ